MPTINGPKVQPPGAITHWIDVVQGDQGQITSITPSLEAAQFFHAAQQICFNVSRSGPTGSRPTKALDARFIGMPYFDTTLGLTVYLKSVTPDVWVNGAGVPV